MGNNDSKLLKSSNLVENIFTNIRKIWLLAKFKLLTATSFMTTSIPYALCTRCSLSIYFSYEPSLLQDPDSDGRTDTVMIFVESKK